MPNYQDYDFTTDTLNSKLNAAKLSDTIKKHVSLGPIFDGINRPQASSIFRCMFIVDLTAENITDLTALVNAHDGEKITEISLVEVTKQDQTPPFASKTLPLTGQKLFRRKHGISKLVPANSSEVLTLSVPYVIAKIDKAEIINCKAGDAVDLKVHDTPTGTISATLAATNYTAVPFLELNQFGFNVQMPDNFYVDKSNYDADLIQGMEVRVTYYNNTNEDRTVGVNITLHEVK